MVPRGLAHSLEGLENRTAVTQNLLGSPQGLGPQSPEQQWPRCGGSSVLRDPVSVPAAGSWKSLGNEGISLLSCLAPYSSPDHLLKMSCSTGFKVETEMDHMTSLGGYEGSPRSLPSTWVGADERHPKQSRHNRAPGHECCKCLRNSSCSGFLCFFSLLFYPLSRFAIAEGITGTDLAKNSRNI